MELQPDQQPALWDDHVALYEAAFEPLTDAFARRALEHLCLRPGSSLLDVAAGSGGAALMAASLGCDVLAVDASPGMAARITQRTRNSPAAVGRLRVACMDGMALDLAPESFDAVLSVFGVILFSDPVLGMQEIARVLKPAGRVAVVTWTQTERYELAARLAAAVATVRGAPSAPAALPAQLRFRDPTALQRLFDSARLSLEGIDLVEERWRLPSARWIADRIAFAPGLAAMTASLDKDRAAVLDAFVGALERDQGLGEVTLMAVAHVGFGRKANV